MPMPPYRVPCSRCDELAAFKIASCWSDGVTQELKTYAPGIGLIQDGDMKLVKHGKVDLPK